MFRSAYQRGMLTVFFSCGSKPLAIWDVYTKDGYITKFLDPDIKSTVFEIGGTNVSTTYMICPKGNLVLGITMPFLVMIVKNLKKYFSFEVTALDDSGTRRRFRVSNFQSTTQILPLCTVMPIGLSDGWNQIQFNLAEFMRRAYKKQYIEVQKLKINANIRIRRIYFAERLLPEDQLPPEYRLYFPLVTKGAKGKEVKGEKDLQTLMETHAEGVIIETEASKTVVKADTKSTSGIRGPSLAPVHEVEVQTDLPQPDQQIVTEAEKFAEQQEEITTEVTAEGDAVAEEGGEAAGTEIKEPTMVEGEEGVVPAETGEPQTDPAVGVSAAKIAEDTAENTAKAPETEPADASLPADVPPADDSLPAEVTPDEALLAEAPPVEVPPAASSVTEVLPAEEAPATAE